MLDARQYGVVELGRGESAGVAGGDDGVVYTVGKVVGFWAGMLYAFSSGASEGTWADWHG